MEQDEIEKIIEKINSIPRPFLSTQLSNLEGCSLRIRRDDKTGEVVSTRELLLHKPSGRFVTVFVEWENSKVKSVEASKVEEINHD